MKSYVDMVINEQMKRIRYWRKHRELCGKQILKLLDTFTDEQLESMLRQRLPEEWDKVIERFRNIEIRKVKI